MDPDEPCGTHILPPHHRVDRGPGDCPPLFKFVVRYKLMPLGVPHSMPVWAPGPETAMRWAERHLLGRYGPFGIVAGSVGLGGAKAKPARRQRAKLGIW